MLDENAPLDFFVVMDEYLELPLLLLFVERLLEAFLASAPKERHPKMDIKTQ